MSSFLGLFKRSDPSANYEKELQVLQTKLAETEKRLLARRLRLRRTKGLFTLYSLVIYIVYVGIVVAKNHMSRELLLAGNRLTLGVLLGPPAIYIVRYMIQAVLGRFVSFDEDRIKYLRQQQEGKLEELKQKTGFYSTKAIVDRYEPKKKEAKKPVQQQPKQNAATNNRQGVPPPTANVPRNIPPTANVPRNIPPTANVPVVKGPDSGPAGASVPSIPKPVPVSEEEVLAAKKSLDKAGASSAPVSTGPYQRQWFDRVLDLLVGEDESAAQNRQALICSKCFTHNGLAPFGKTAAEIRYKCPSCGEWNGNVVPSEVAELVEEKEEEVEEEDEDSVVPAEVQELVSEMVSEVPEVSMAS
ncbi:Protein lunapark [Yarrowia sp. E02]|nr:Protein lunapark [Yarrowia sp. E02]